MSRAQVSDKICKDLSIVTEIRARALAIFTDEHFCSRRFVEAETCTNLAPTLREVQVRQDKAY